MADAATGIVALLPAARASGRRPYLVAGSTAGRQVPLERRWSAESVVRRTVRRARGLVRSRGSTSTKVVFPSGMGAFGVFFFFFAE
jgi:hypothetical protein